METSVDGEAGYGIPTFRRGVHVDPARHRLRGRRGLPPYGAATREGPGAEYRRPGRQRHQTPRGERASRSPQDLPGPAPAGGSGLPCDPPVAVGNRRRRHCSALGARSTRNSAGVVRALVAGRLWSWSGTSSPARSKHPDEQAVVLAIAGRGASSRPGSGTPQFRERGRISIASTTEYPDPHSATPLPAPPTPPCSDPLGTACLVRALNTRGGAACRKPLKRQGLFERQLVDTLHP